MGFRFHVPPWLIQNLRKELQPSQNLKQVLEGFSKTIHLHKSFSSNSNRPIWKAIFSLSKGYIRPSPLNPSQGLGMTFYHRIKNLNSMEYSSSGFGDPAHRAFIALGSNIGNRVQFIENACDLMDQTEGIQIIRTSGLWETKAMYVINQDDFLNGVCEVLTTLSPIKLLDRLQQIENQLGRVKIIDKGPRNIDLDVLLYDDQILESERLIIPHKLMLERDFVLRPLCQLIPDEKPPGSLGSKTFATYLDQITSQSLSGRSKPLPTSTLTFMGNKSIPLRPLISSRRTRIMSILNLTPDSFSDGGIHSPNDLEYLNQTLGEMIKRADIIDIGGQSTRPHSKLLSADEELDRILPAVDIAVKLRTNQTISVDTFYSKVAEKVLEAGVDMINDVSSGTMDPKLFSVVAHQGCSIILMHMRGTPQTMHESKHHDYGNDIVRTIGKELLDRVQSAERAGIRRWKILLDPGFGFAKTFDQQIELLGRFSELKEYPGLEGFPWVIGLSRKKFIQELAGLTIDTNPSSDELKRCKMSIGTSGALMVAIQKGVDIVRVHDSLESSVLTTIGDIMWRGLTIKDVKS